MKLLAFIWVLAFSCISCDKNGVTDEGKRPYYDLRVKNLSNVDIFPVVISAESGIREQFGGVVSGGSSTVGFGPMKFSGKMIVVWQEASSETDYAVEFDTGVFLPMSASARRVSFVYRGEMDWYIQVLDAKHEIISQSNIGRLIDFKNPDGSDVVNYRAHTGLE